jgi:hypothetical protein
MDRDQLLAWTTQAGGHFGIGFWEIAGGMEIRAFAELVRAAALEEAAKVAEDEFDAYSCAAAIRDLIPKEKP